MRGSTHKNQPSGSPTSTGNSVGGVGGRKTVRIAGGSSNAAAEMGKSGVSSGINNSFNMTREGLHRSHGGSSSDSSMIGDDTISLLSKISLLEKDLERRQASYNTREESYTDRVAQLEEELMNQGVEKPGWAKADANISKLKAIQSEILNSVELVQDRTARIMQEQERDLLRSFRARLFDVQTELEKEKSKKDDGLTAWKERHAQLSAELSWAAEVAQRLDKVNTSLLQENNQLKAKFVSQEEDRNFFVKKLVAVKKENALLRAQNAEIQTEILSLEAQSSELAEQVSGQIASPMPMSPMKASAGNTANQAWQLAQQQNQKNESEEKYKDINVRLRRLLSEEQKSLQQMRQTYAQELKIRTEMELLLRNCVEDVRRAIVDHHHAVAEFNQNTAGNDLAKLYSSKPGMLPLDAFEREEQQRNLELLLSQERVVSLIYAKTFPIANVSSTIGDKHHSNGFGQPSSAPNLPGMPDNQSSQLMDLISDRALEVDSIARSGHSKQGSAGVNYEGQGGKLPTIPNR